MKEGRTYGLSPKRLARLPADGVPLSATQVNPRAAETLTEALPVILSHLLSVDPTKPYSLPAFLNRPCDEALAIICQPTSDLLLNLKTEPKNQFQRPALLDVYLKENLNNSRLLRGKEVMVIRLGRHSKEGGGTLPLRT